MRRATRAVVVVTACYAFTELFPGFAKFLHMREMSRRDYQVPTRR